MKKSDLKDDLYIKKSNFFDKEWVDFRKRISDIEILKLHFKRAITGYPFHLQ